MKRYGFITPRYGPEIGGGAETLVREVAERLAARGDSVEAFTTCARDNRTWQNDFSPGTSSCNGVTVTRFPVDPRNLDIWVPRQIQISEGLLLSLEDQFAWMEHGVNSSALYAHIKEVASRFDALFFAPYLFGTTFWGSLVCPEKSILIPCLHDERYAYLDCIASMFRQVRGCLFNALPEMDLAERLYGPMKGGEVGMGFVPYPEGEGVGLPPYFKEPFPYILYVGRKETGKNAHLLVDNFIALKEGDSRFSDLRLVIVGGGDFSDLHRPQAATRGDILDLPHVSELEKRQIIRHAEFLCQPSVNESFSIVIMESWLLKRPVVVHAQCAVTRHHVLESGGGLYFDTPSDFSAVARSLLTDKTLASRLGEAGDTYVRTRYDWGAVLERFDRVVEKIIPSQPTPS